MRYEAIVVGGGFAGIECAKILARRLGSPRAVGLVSERNYMVFHPLLAEVCGSSLSPQDIVSPIRHLCEGVDVYTGRVDRIDLSGRTLGFAPGKFTPERSLEFRHLVLAMGSVIDLRSIPGMAEHAFLMKGVGDALGLRTALVDRLEEANWETSSDRIRELLTAVVVGGGFSGVETAGQILDFLLVAKSYFANLKKAEPRVVLVQSGGSLLPELHSRLGAYAEKQLRGRGMEIILGNRVVSVTAGKSFLRDGYVRQGRVAAENILRSRQSLPLRPFRHKALGQLASIGRRKAVGDVLGLHLSGPLLWFLWRTLYLFKLPGIEDKLRVMLQWTFELFFPRDISQFRPEATTTARESFLQPGTLVFEKGDPAPNFYLVKAGAIEVEGGDGNKVEIGEGGRLDQALLDANGRWGCHARAMRPTRLVYMDREGFLLLTRGVPESMDATSVIPGSPTRKFTLLDNPESAEEREENALNHESNL